VTPVSADGLRRAPVLRYQGSGSSSSLRSDSSKSLLGIDPMADLEPATTAPATEVPPATSKQAAQSASAMQLEGTLRDEPDDMRTMKKAASIPGLASLEFSMKKATSSAGLASLEFCAPQVVLAPSMSGESVMTESPKEGSVISEPPDESDGPGSPNEECRMPESQEECDMPERNAEGVLPGADEERESSRLPSPQFTRSAPVRMDDRCDVPKAVSEQEPPEVQPAPATADALLDDVDDDVNSKRADSAYNLDGVSELRQRSSEARGRSQVKEPAQSAGLSLREGAVQTDRDRQQSVDADDLSSDDLSSDEDEPSAQEPSDNESSNDSLMLVACCVIAPVVIVVALIVVAGLFKGLMWINNTNFENIQQDYARMRNHGLHAPTIGPMAAPLHDEL